MDMLRRLISCRIIIIIMSKLLHQTCIARLVKYLSPYTGCISE